MPRIGIRVCQIVAALQLVSGALSASDGPGAGTASFGHLSIEDGLSQSIVESIVQDRHGFLWFATEDGLNRYDGYGFSVYRNRAGDPGSLSHNELETVYEDREGVLWVGVFAGGLNRLDPATDRVTRFCHDPNDPASLAAQTVQCVLEDRAGRLWVGTNGGGLDLLDRDSGKFSHHRIDGGGAPVDGSNDIHALCEDREGGVWVGTNGGGVARRDPHTGRFTVYRHHAGSALTLARSSLENSADNR